MKNLQN